MLIITDIQGNQAPVTQNQNPEISLQLNQVGQLKTTIYDWPQNHAGFEMLAERSIITIPEENQEYRITDRQEVTSTGVQAWSITAFRIIHDLQEHDVQNPVVSSGTAVTPVTETAQAFMERITAGTNFSFTIHDDLGSHVYDSGLPVGKALDLFLNTFLKDYNAEFTSDNYHIDIYKKIGADNSFVFIDGGNVKSITRHYDDTTITTHAKGQCNPVAEESKTDTVPITAEYTSPAADVYGIIDASYLTDSAAHDQPTLLQHLKANVQDYPLMQLTLEYDEFEKNSKIAQSNKIELGNSGFIRSRRGLDITSRITGITYYPQDDNTMPKLTLGNVIGSFTQTIAQLKGASNKRDEQPDKSKLLAEQIQDAVGMGTITKEVGTSTVNQTSRRTRSVGTSIRQVATADSTVYFPQTSWDAVLGFGSGLSQWVKDNNVFVFNQIAELIEKWHEELSIPKQIKLQSENGTVFLLSVNDDGQLITTREADDAKA